MEDGRIERIVEIIGGLIKELREYYEVEVTLSLEGIKWERLAKPEDIV